MTSAHNYLAIQKAEWDRIRRIHSPTKYDEKREEYFKSLIEQSQNWMKLWPDTVQGHVNLLNKQEKSKRAKLVETVKTFSSTEKFETSSDAIKKAKELIFADSCFGRQLLSALLQSKTLEERDLQIKFQHDLKREINSSQIDAIEPCSLIYSYSKQMEINEKKTIMKCKQTAKEIAKFNDEMFSLQKEKQLKERDEIKREFNNTNFFKDENGLTAKRPCILQQEIKEYETENKKIKHFRAIREEEEERRRLIWQKYQERIRCREKAVFDKIHKEKYNTPQSQKVFKTIQNIQENKKRQYNEFVQKGVDRLLERTRKLDEIETRNKNLLCNQRKLIDEENKIKAEYLTRIPEINRYSCCKQCILPKSSGIKNKKKDLKKDDVTSSCFLSRNSRYSPSLKHRLMEPSPGNAFNAMHKQFSQYATEVLKECRYKHSARKVVDEYRRVNGLNSNSLPVPNYY